MPDAPSPLACHYGDIVLVANLLDPNRVNPKDRPCVIMTDPASPPPQGTHLVIAISTALPDPLPVEYVLLPYYHPRHPVTGLNKRAAAICPWVDEVDGGRILREIGVVPNRILLKIAAEVAKRSPNE